QRPVTQLLTVIPAIQGLKFDLKTYAVHQTIANASTLRQTPSSITTDANGLAKINSQNQGFQAYLVNRITVQRPGSTMLAGQRLLSSDSTEDSPAIHTDTIDPVKKDHMGGPDSVNGPGEYICMNCPGSATSDNGESESFASGTPFTDFAEGEAKDHTVDLIIP